MTLLYSRLTDKIIRQPNLGELKPIFPGDVCGNSSSTDFKVLFTLKEIYSTVQYDLYLRITPKIASNSTIASLGFRELTMFFLNKTDNGTEDFCYSWKEVL